MAWRQAQSLTARLLLTVLGLVLAVWVLTLAVSWSVTRHELNELLDAHLAETAALLATGEFDDEDQPDGRVIEAPEALHKYQSRVAYQIWRGEHLRARSADAPTESLTPRTAGFSDQQIDGTSWRVFTTRRLHDGKPREIIHVAEQTAARRHVLLGSLRGLTLPLGVALPLLAVGIVWSVRRSLAPLRRLSARVAERQAASLEPLPEPQDMPEVRPLVRALNGLFERVADQMESERRFTADAAHELRTPIAAIRMQAQVAQGATQDAERATALAATVAGCDRATHLVEQLLQMARLEAEAAGSARSAPLAPLNAVLNDVAREVRRAAEARQQRLTLEPSPDAPAWRAAPSLVAVLLRNLMDNALRYSPAGSTVVARVEVDAAAQAAVLTVEDSGPGLDEAALARLGERFFRVLGTGQSGSGLGWSIVRRIARIEGLDVKVDRSPALGGLRVRVRGALASGQDGAPASAPG